MMKDMTKYALTNDKTYHLSEISLHYAYSVKPGVWLYLGATR